MPKNYTLLFINGIYRSGTTFLSRLIDAFPSTYIYEDGFRIPYYYLLDREKSMVYPRDMQKKKKLQLNTPPENFLSFKKNLQREIKKIPLNIELKQKLLEFTKFLQREKTFLEIAQSIFDLTQEYSKAAIVGTKTTYQHNYINDVLKFFSHAKWIEITRDPRAIYCSAKKSHSTDLKFTCDVWNNAMEVYFNIESKHADRFLLIKYEDLILNPENTVSLIQKFLNLGINTKVFLRDLSLRRNDNSFWFSNSSYKQNGILWRDVDVKTVEYFDKNPVFRWQKILNRLEKRIIANRCKLNIEKMGLLIENNNKRYSMKDIYEIFLWLFKVSTLKFIIKDIFTKYKKLLPKNLSGT